jgi:hypothetical protein
VRLGKEVSSVKEITAAEIGLEVNADKTKYMATSQDQKAGV